MKTTQEMLIAVTDKFNKLEESTEEVGELYAGAIVEACRISPDLIRLADAALTIAHSATGTAREVLTAAKAIIKERKDAVGALPALDHMCPPKKTRRNGKSVLLDALGA